MDDEVHNEARTCMKIREVILESAALREGVNDPAIFKCVFVIGGPGSGKSAVSSMLGLRALGYVSINSDEAFTHQLKKRGLDLKMPPEEEAARNAARSRAKEMTATKMVNALEGRLGVVIDGTGEDLSKIAKVKSQLGELGYEFYLVVVYANLETAKRRNAGRDRSVPESVVEKKWHGVQRNMDNFLEMFENSMIIDNNGTIQDLRPQIDNAYKQIVRWTDTEPQLPAALDWIADQLGDNEPELDDDDLEEPEDDELDDTEDTEDNEDDTEDEEDTDDQLGGVRQSKL